MANLLNDYEQDVVDTRDYQRLLDVYTATHRKDGRPYVAESADPLDASWFGSDLANHSEHYLHSGYVDLVLSGLLGIRPTADDSVLINPLVPAEWDYFAVEGVAYHGHDLAMRWDRDGSRYGRGSGFTVLIDGRVVLRSASPRDVTIPVARGDRTMAFEKRHNVPVNNGRRFPEIRTSFAHPETPPLYANDGGIWYHDVPTNRWTTVGSPHEEDWIQVDFGVGQRISEVTLYFVEGFDDIVPPARYAVEVLRDGTWIPAPEGRRAPERPAGRRPNRVFLEPVVAEGVRVRLRPADGYFLGLSELEVWTPAGAEVAKPDPSRRTGNLALNPDGRDLPRVSASYVRKSDDVRVVALPDRGVRRPHILRPRFSRCDRRDRNSGLVNGGARPS